MNPPYIDIHTHLFTPSKGVLSIENLFLQNIDPLKLKERLFTTAIHPWHAAQFNTDQVLAMFNEILSHPGLIAIGETGLDRCVDVDFQKQTKLFTLQEKIAYAHQKPLILHLVKAWTEFIPFIKQARTPLIIHGYSEGLELTRQLADRGCYFSVGKSILNLSPRKLEGFLAIPLNALFLETDESKTSIETIYQAVSSKREISIEALKTQIYTNFKRLFSNTLADGASQIATKSHNSCEGKSNRSI